MTNDKEQLTQIFVLLCMYVAMHELQQAKAQISILEQKLAVNQHFFEQMCEDYEHD